jgi:hypothetical protein
MRTLRRSISLIAFLAVLASGGSAAGKRPVPLVFVTKGGTTGLVVGASFGSRWINWEKAKDHFKAGDKFRFFATTGTSSVKSVSKPVLSQASGTAYSVSVKRASQKSCEVGLPVSTGWKTAPRKAGPVDVKDGTVRMSVVQLLRFRGIASPQFEIVQAKRCDLDGDGAFETIIEARSPGLRKEMREGGAARVGQFSLVALREHSTTSLIAGEVRTKEGDDSGPPQLYELTHLLDLNGDGKMEIVVETTYYEGGGAQVFEWNGRKVTKVLDVSDGL